MRPELGPARSLKYYVRVYSFKAMKMLMRLVYGKEKAAAKDRGRACAPWIGRLCVGLAL